MVIAILGAFEVMFGNVMNTYTYIIEFPEVDISQTININPFVDGIVILIILAAIGGAIGIKVLASGLSERSIYILSSTIFLSGIWVGLSIWSYGWISSIETFGTFIYVFITLMYVVGAILSMISSAGDSG